MRIIFVILHKLIMLAFGIYWFGEYFLAKIREFLNCGNPEDLDRDKKYIEHKIRNLDKVPIHLTIVLGNEQPQYNILGKLVIWAASAGIGHISFYDHEGAIKINNDKIRSYVKNTKSDQDQIIWGPDINDSDVLIPPKNGFKTRLLVNFFNLDNGKGQVIKTCKEVATDVKQGTLQLDDITINFIDEKLRKAMWGLPDPDLVLYFGNVCATYGLLPWQIRLTEFSNVPPQSCITAADFVKALYRFSKCEQRFGK